MNRELKFRVWNGSEMIYDVTVGKFGNFYVNPGDKKNGLDPNDSASLTPFNTKYSDTAPVMQFTGLKDKNKKEIYEGDIVQLIVLGSNGEITASANEIVEYKSSSFSPMVYHNTDFMSVIGNIYENPELINN